MRHYDVVSNDTANTHTIIFKDDFDETWSVYLELEDVDKAIEIVKALNKENQ